MKFNLVIWRTLGLIALITVISFTLLNPAQAQPARQGQDIAQITSPTEGQTINGLVAVTGTADQVQFDRWELAYGPDPNPNDAWQPFASGDQPVINGIISTWNTGVIADGGYMLRLRAVRKDSNFSEAIVRGLQVRNSVSAETPTPESLTPTVPAEQATFSAQEAARPIATVMVEQPPTSVPEVVVVNAATPLGPDSQRRGSTAVAGFNLGGFGSACLSGAALAAGLFVVVGVIQAGRWGVRRYRRQIKRRS
jgi:hypothetical protein